MDGLFTTLGAALQGGSALALLAALGWGVLSVLLSPCHLATIPLVVGFVGAVPGGKRDRPAILSSLFALGMFVALGVAGALIAVVGQALQGYRHVGAYAVAAVLLLAGLHLLDLVPLPITGVKVGAMKGKGRFAALSAGLFLGLGLSPCTFAFIAPVLGAGLGAAAASAARGLSLLLAFALGHCAVIAVAGASTGLAQRYLDWNERSRGVTVLKAVCGGLLLLGAASLVYSA